MKATIIPTSERDAMVEALRTALAALKQIEAICADNSGTSCSHRMALTFVREVARKAAVTAGVTP